MKATLAFPVAGLCGTDRGSPERNWYRYRGQQVVRLPPVGAPRNTFSQRISRMWFRLAAQAYQNLTREEAEAWDAWSRVTGNFLRECRGPMTGPAAYQQVNWIRQAGIGGISDEVPTVTMPWRCTEVLEVKEAFGGQKYHVEWETNAPAGVVQETQIMLSKGFDSPARRARQTDMRSLGGLGEDVVLQTKTGPGPHEVTRDQLVLALHTGQWCEAWVRLHSVDGWPGVWDKFSVVCE